MDHSTLLGTTWADYAIVGVVFFSVAISLMRGFVREAFSLVTWVIAFWVALHFNNQLSTLLAQYIATPSLRLIASFGFLFIVSLIIGSLLGFLISRLIVSTGLSGTDRSIGLIFGFARGILLVGIVLLMLSFTACPEDAWYKNSILIPHFQPLVLWLKGFLPQTIKQVSSFVTQAHTL